LGAFLYLIHSIHNALRRNMGENMASKFNFLHPCKPHHEAKEPASYSVYLHHANANNPNTMQFWEKVETTTNKKDAIDKARTLYHKKKCPVVEVKKKYKHAKRHYIINETIKTYGDIKTEPLTWYIKIALGLIICALAMTGISAFIAL
jgi:ABC-type nickel/cobalt efflux system permease component RcnA